MICAVYKNTVRTEDVPKFPKLLTNSIFPPYDLFFFPLGWPAHRVLLGHRGRVTCLLYPHDDYRRYDKEFLVSGGADFSVKLWDIFTGDLLYTFSTHGGGLCRLMCTPPDCSVSLIFY